MWKPVKSVTLSAVVAVGVLAFATNSAQAQVPVYGYSYSSPYDYGPIGIGTFYNAVNRYPTPFLPTYAGYGSYYNYVNFGPPAPYFYGPAPVYGGYYHGRYRHHHHWRP